jgi:hypothetical protein
MPDMYNSLITEELDLGEEAVIDDLPKSAAESESLSPNETDLQTTLKMMFPKFEDKEIQSVALAIMMARVFPDNFSTKIYLLVISIAKAHRHDNDFNVIKTMQLIESIAQIGLDGKGRVEAVILQGNARETAEAEANKSGGF